MSEGVDPGPLPPPEPLPPRPPARSDPPAPARPAPDPARAPPRPPPLPGGARRWELEHEAAVAARGPTDAAGARRVDERPEADGADAAAAAPYVPVLPGRRPRWWALLLGAGLIALGLWMTLGVAPEVDAILERADARAARTDVEAREEDPLESVRRVTRRWGRRSVFGDDEPSYEIGDQTFTREELEAVRVVGWFLVATGLAMAALLGTHRPGRIRFCSACERDTLFRKRGGWRCERCGERW